MKLPLPMLPMGRVVRMKRIGTQPRQVRVVGNVARLRKLRAERIGGTLPEDKGLNVSATSRMNAPAVRAPCRPTLSRASRAPAGFSGRGNP